MIPILYENCEIPTLLKDKFWADMRGEKYEESLSMIIERIKEIKSSSPNNADA